MRILITISILLFSFFHSFGQERCKDGFKKIRLNHKKVSAPCLDYDAGKGLELRIKRSDSLDSNHAYFVDVTFYNPTDSLKRIYWYDFVNSWGVPLSFSFGVNDSSGSTNFQHRNWQFYMDPSVFYNTPRINEEIIIPPEQSYTRAIRIWWTGGMKSDNYTLTLGYGGYHWPSVLSSNTLIISIEESPIKTDQH